MNNDEEGARLTRMEENRKRIAKHRAEVDGSPAPQHRLVRYDLGGRGDDVGMEVDASGDYVLYEDVVALLSERGTGCAAQDFDERWLLPGGIVPVDMPTTGALVREIQRLREDQRDSVADGLTVERLCTPQSESHPTQTTNKVCICVHCGEGIPVDMQSIDEAHAKMIEHETKCDRNPLVRELAEARSQLAAARADERERCAKVCDDLVARDWWGAREAYAAEIRAQGEGK